MKIKTIAATLLVSLSPALALAQSWDPPQVEPPYRFATKTPRNCVDRAGFPNFLMQARAEAQRRGIGQRGLAALEGLSFDDQIVSRDRGQKVFTQTFEEFSGRMVPPRLGAGRKKMQQHQQLLQRIEREFGVPAGVIVAIWGLETDYGAFLGTFPTVRAIATLAYDCRRPEKFRPELMAILKIVDQGNLDPASAKGAWAGEIGQTQFMPTSYVKFAIDYDRDGRIDLVRSVPDVLASTANFLRGSGWQRGQGWQPGQPNFAAILQWNKAEVYARTIAYFAERLESGR
ncbi:MAG: lytic murein transglycosylase [Pseudolabrys sp.]|nr:lytic murein transglycosylase [Pseudolabrys sp.]MBV9956551.1 lytic murein transglycosylase [Pseudolabrys sp.]